MSVTKIVLILSILMYFPVYDIPMDYELQKHTYKVCQQNDNMSYELVLAIINKESSFKPDAKNGASMGLMQINTANTLTTIEKGIGKTIDPLNPYENIEGGVWYLNYLRQYWLDQGASDEEVFGLMLSSYNQGLDGHIKNGYKYTQKYIDDIFEYKCYLEQKGALYYGDLH